MKSFNKLFHETLGGYKVMVRRYPKAAKKRRILKKWKRRFGRGLSELLIQQSEYQREFWRRIQSDDIWKGQKILIPLVSPDTEPQTSPPEA